MKHSKIMTAILNDGSQITGLEVSRTIHDDQVTLECDGQQIPVNLNFCITYFEEWEPVQFIELTKAESIELEKLGNLSALIHQQAW